VLWGPLITDDRQSAKTKLVAAARNPAHLAQSLPLTGFSSLVCRLLEHSVVVI
jgi:hypothetical protein